MTYGGTERNISYLDSLYTKLGHNSLVAAPGDSVVDGTLIETISESIWKEKNGVKEFLIDNTVAVEEHYKNIVDFIADNKDLDVIHDHPGESILSQDYFWENKHRIKVPILTTLHAYPFPEELRKFDKLKQAENYGIFFNCISKSQKRLFEANDLDVRNVIYHGIPIDGFPFAQEHQGYLFNLGRICYDKGQDVAIKTALALDMPLILAGEVREKDYFDQEIAPYIDGKQIKFIGGLNDQEKVEWYQNAAAFLMPIRWEEPFGLVMPEAMACGTPVVAYSRGSVPEVITDGKTGYVVDENLESFINATEKALQLNRHDCRKRVEDYFTITHEARNYLDVYRQLKQ
ncbi:MAG: glycosyltransferase family 4 protein [Nanobdellota archaeon]